MQAVTRTTAVYVDRNVLYVSYQLSDDASEARVSHAGLDVELELSFGDGSTVTVPCGMPAAER